MEIQTTDKPTTNYK